MWVYCGPTILIQAVTPFVSKLRLDASGLDIFCCLSNMIDLGILADALLTRHDGYFQRPVMA